MKKGKREGAPDIIDSDYAMRGVKEDDKVFSIIQLFH